MRNSDINRSFDYLYEQDYFTDCFVLLQAKETELLGWNKVVNEAKSKVCVAITNRKQRFQLLTGFSCLVHNKLCKIRPGY